jgi:hypothetical protein
MQQVRSVEQRRQTGADRQITRLHLALEQRVQTTWAVLQDDKI